MPYEYKSSRFHLKHCDADKFTSYIHSLEAVSWEDIASDAKKDKRHILHKDRVDPKRKPEFENLGAAEFFRLTYRRTEFVKYDSVGKIVMREKAGYAFETQLNGTPVKRYLPLAEIAQEPDYLAGFEKLVYEKMSEATGLLFKLYRLRQSAGAGVAGLAGMAGPWGTGRMAGLKGSRSAWTAKPAPTADRD